MRKRTATALCATLALLAGCGKRDAKPTPEPTTAPSPQGTEVPGPVASAALAPSPPPSATGTTAAELADAAALLDQGALSERRNPDRLLRFYAAALRQGRWSQAARAWRSTSGVNADTLKAAYDRGQPPMLTLGKGEVEGAAGSLYYEVPVTLRFAAGPPQTGTLTLRRVNNVPGASAEQLVWRIERSTIGAGQ